MAEKTKYYPEVQAKADFPALEQEILAYWKRDDTFKKACNTAMPEKKGTTNTYFTTGLRLRTVCRITAIW